MTSPSPHDPGLDLTALRTRHGLRRDLTLLTERIHAHLEQHQGFVSFSGGKDSTVVVDLARRVDPDVPVCWFDSGMEFPETRAYIEALADRWDLNLYRLNVTPSGLDVLASSGAWDLDAPDRPVPDLHEVLVTAPSRHAHAAHGAGSLWGVRAAESRGRAQLYRTALARTVTADCHGCCAPTDKAAQRQRHGGTVRRIDDTVTYGPIWDWSTEDVWTYLAVHGIPPNPVYARLAELGAEEHVARVGALVGANLVAQGRMTWLQAGWPDLFEEFARRLPRLRTLT